jgi:hypothetical protein
MIFFWLACTSFPLKATESGPDYTGEPTITAVRWSCDAEDNRWVFTVDTEQWSSGGRVWLGRSSVSNESHPLASIEAAGDGSADQLQIKLSVATDWRTANSGSSSQYTCEDKWNLSYIITVHDTEQGHTTDCRLWGAEPEMWGRVDVAPTCEKSLAWDPPLDTGDLAGQP